jgi:hypothetical protein
MPRRITGSVALVVILVLGLLGGWFLLQRLPKGAVGQFLDHPWQSVKSSAGFLASTSGYDGRWHTRDVDDPPVMMDVRFSVHACEVTEFLPGGGTKRTRFADRRNPPGGGGQVILSDGDRYLMVPRDGPKTLRLDIPDGPWEPFKDPAGRAQHRRKQKTIHLIQ